MYVCLYVCHIMCVCVYVCMYVCVCVCVCVCTFDRIDEIACLLSRFVSMEDRKFSFIMKATKSRRGSQIAGIMMPLSSSRLRSCKYN